LAAAILKKWANPWRNGPDCPAGGSWGEDGSEQKACVLLFRLAELQNRSTRKPKQFFAAISSCRVCVKIFNGTVNFPMLFRHADFHAGMVGT
jgi:hypothetical protein